ncbi:hypothetical protein [Bacillus sp. BP-3]|nr:hypothetical protein [Bacillus sp. BP-3]
MKDSGVLGEAIRRTSRSRFSIDPAPATRIFGGFASFAEAKSASMS